jgi:lipopolysaccharide biosynthesis glycosyltransferase
MGNSDGRQQINIMTSCDDNLARYILPQIASITANLSAYHVDFYLFHSRIKADNILRIREYAQDFAHFSFHEIIVENTKPFEALAQPGGGWAYEAYFSLCCHEYLPKNVDRILYIDAGDVIIDGDIAEYYFGDFCGFSLLATIARFSEKRGRGSEITAFCKEDLADEQCVMGIKRGLINSGSYVINVAQFRKDNLTAEDFLYVSRILCERFPDHNPVYFGDQGLISVAFAGDIKYFAYPEIKNLWYMPYNFCLWFFDRMETPWYTPKILHYAGVCFKPWQARFSADVLKNYDFQTDFTNVYAPFSLKYKQVELFEIWWRYCEKTPIYDAVNAEASIYARALEKHYLPLCKQYNELVSTNLMLREKLNRHPTNSATHKKKKRK